MMSKKEHLLSDASKEVEKEKLSKPPPPPLRPWYIRGGLHVNVRGMAVNLAAPPIFLAYTASNSNIVRVFWSIFLLQVILAVQVHKMRTLYCVIGVSLCMTSLLVLPGTLNSRIVPTLILAALIGIWKIGICMSVCLHRYAAHAAFKCGPITQLFINILGCAANQGGPIWWAAHHRCHHKYCDVPRDPHSAIIDGVEKAFGFFMMPKNYGVNEEFVPKHNDSPHLRLVDTWSFIVNWTELILAYYFFGREGLFVAHTSMWLSQMKSLWVNIAQHPPDSFAGSVTQSACKAANYIARATGYYPAFLLLDCYLVPVQIVVGESEHLNHHNHAHLAKRGSTDFPYYTFIKPLMMLSLIWDVKLKE